jgi:protein involved in polysaccharide export with SLBB domain
LDAVSGTYTVQNDGTVSVALVGAFTTTGQTTRQLADGLAVALEHRVGSVEPPSVVAEVVEYSPFYIIGDVEKPGAFEATPGLTAIQAFALAGGLPKLGGGTSGDVTAGLRDTGNLSQTRLDLLRAKIASARLQAESEGLDVVSFPGNLRHPDGAEVLAELFDGERQVFDSRKLALAREQTSLSDLIALLQAEVASLEAKIIGVEPQVSSAELNLTNMTKLVERGLARGPQLSTAQRNLFELESKALDLQNGIYRAQQRIKEAERDQANLISNRATTAAFELQDVNAKIEALGARSQMLRGIILERGTDIGSSDDIGTIVTNLDVQRGKGEARVNLSGPDTVLMAGDILRVAQTNLAED